MAKPYKEIPPESTATNPLALDLVEWIAVQPRRYEDVMDAWRTSCPRLTIWEDAIDLGLVVRHRQEGVGMIVKVTPLGLARLREAGRLPSAEATTGAEPT